ncbi:chitinase-3-like protein 2 isoform X2 [Contarinia nasturtii]|uniref:chitinase-3-like protein 2 isoform X2 n=1 Tax=Contarinia nasturtii TaxID=265458 RepID=UPI0012D3F432|nr:chitinase-3-like protein 2 isoform X2 [Contarinia nasturtii]
MNTITGQSTKYQQINKQRSHKMCIQVCFTVIISIVCCTAMMLAVSSYNQSQPIEITDTLQQWSRRESRYSNEFMLEKRVSEAYHSSMNAELSNESTISDQSTPSSNNDRKLVCYYTIPESNLKKSINLQLDKIDAFLCTHINIGVAVIENSKIVITDELKVAFEQMTVLKQLNNSLKVLIWIGGPTESISFFEMIRTHENRKEFIKSIKLALEKYHLDGVDIDWEFPITYDKSRIYLTKLLHEIRKEYERERRNYLLSVAVAAPEGIAYFAYDVEALNQFCDYINIMTYDYHFYSKSTPFTGLNAPLYSRKNENSLLSTLNINASVSFWHEKGLDKQKIIVGLPTYGHSFRLINPFNNKLGSPASGFGRTGEFGFVTYPEVCLFERHNIFVTKVFDADTCSPYIFAGDEWISYEDDNSIKCKTEYVIKGDFGGVMIFSLNTDDFSSYCYYGSQKYKKPKNFPLTRLVNELLIWN